MNQIAKYSKYFGNLSIMTTRADFNKCERNNEQGNWRFPYRKVLGRINEKSNREDKKEEEKGRKKEAKKMTSREK